MCRPLASLTAGQHGNFHPEPGRRLPRACQGNYELTWTELRRANLRVPIYRPTGFLASVIVAVLVAGAVTQASSDCIPPPAGMTHWYPGDTDASDLVGNNPGSLETGATAGTPGEVSGAFALDGVSGGIDLGDVPDFDFTQSSSFTVEAWIDTFGPTGNDVQFVFAFNYQCTPTDEILAIANSGPDAGKIGFEVRDAMNVSTDVVSPAALTTNVFHHVAVVREVVASVATLKLYVDGTLVGMATDASTGALDFSPASDFIGRRFPCADLSSFNGLIDELTTYDRALSDSEIQAIAAAGSAGKCKSPPTTSTSTTSTSTTLTTTTTSTLTTTSVSTTTASTTSTTVRTTTTTSSTAPQPTTTSTTQPAGGCANEPVGPTFVSLNCQLAALIAEVSGETALGTLQPKLLDELQNAKMHKEQAEMLCRQASKRRTRNALRPAINRVARFVATLGSRKARTIPPNVTSPLRTAAETIRTDLHALQRAVQCPQDAPSA